MEEEKKFNHPIDRVDDRLHARKATSSPDERHRLRVHDVKVEHVWDDTDEEGPKNTEKKKASFFQSIFVVALAFCIIAAGFLWFSTIRGRSTLSNENITIAISSKQFVDGGEDLGFRVDITNANAAALELVDMVVEYPLSSDSELGRDIERLRRPIGTIPARGTIDEEFDIRLFGAEGDQRAITVVLEYRVAGSSAIFTKSEDVLVGIRSAPAVVLIDAPERLVAGQDITLNISIISNVEDPLQSTGLTLEYPSGFIFKSASIPPTYGTTSWDLGALTVGDIRQITVTGQMQGEIGQSATFRAKVGKRDISDVLALDTVYSSRSHSITLEDSFLALDTRLDQSSDSIVAYDSNDTVRGSIGLTNTLPTNLSDVRVIVELDGQLYDPDTIRIERGRYDSNTGQLSWTQDSEPNLSLLTQGTQRTLTFSFDIKGSDIENTVNPSMQLVVHIRATGQDGTIYEAQNVTSRTIVLNSNAVLEQQTLHASGPLPNVGSVPLSVGQPTTYTIHWDIHNSSNALTDAQVRTVLPSYVAWTGQTSPQSERITYNTETREIIWDIGSVVNGAGFGSPARDVYFQISVTPSSADVGQRLDLTRQVTMTATDSFTNQLLQSIKLPHSTKLLGDSIEDNGFVE